MSLLYSDVEEELRGAVRKVLADRAPWQSVLRRIETDTPYDPALWRTLAVDIGVAGLPVPEERGGAGATWRESAVAAEEIGRAAAPVPFLGSALATAALLPASRAGELLARAASGEVTVTLAVSLATPSNAGLPDTVKVSDGTLSGEIASVADALTADILLVPAAAGLWAVEAGDVRRAPVTSLDPTRPLADLAFASAPGRLLVAGTEAAAGWTEALIVGATLLAAEQLGIAEWCLATTVEYAKTRQQFGRPIGSFQAVKHRLAELWVSVTQARAAARYAAGCVADTDPDAPVAASLAQAYCSPLAVRAAEECVQLHGGIGFTWEHPAHLYLKRAKADAVALGTAGGHRAVLADLLNLAPSTGDRT